MSYGTFWLAGLVKLYPNIADAYIFDSVVSPSGADVFSFSDWDRNLDATVRLLLSKCSADSFCSGKLSTNAVAYAVDVVNAVYNASTPGGSCAAVLSVLPTRYDLGTLLANLFESVYSRPLIPSVFYRLKRCQTSDVTALANLVAAFAPATAGTCDASFSNAVNFQVIAAELYNPNVTAGQAAAASASYVFSQNAAQSLYAVRQAWSPAYAAPFLRNVTTPTAKPILILAGELDAQTPPRYARSFAAQFNPAQVTVAVVANGFHAVLGTAMVRTTSPPLDCGAQVLAAFIAAPLTAPNLTCLNSSTVYEFQGTNEGNTYFYGTTNAYDGVPAGTPINATPFIIALACVGAAFLIAVGVIIYLCVLLNRRDAAFDATAYQMNSYSSPSKPAT